MGDGNEMIVRRGVPRRSLLTLILNTMVVSGRVVACAGLVGGLGLLLLGVVHVASVYGVCVLVGLDSGPTIPSASIGAMSAAPKLSGSASGLAGALTVGGWAAMSSLTGAILIADNVTPCSA